MPFVKDAYVVSAASTSRSSVRLADDLPHEMAETQSPPRFGGPEEVMSMTRFLLCEVIYSTGTEFIIDGGAIVDRMELVTRDLPPSLGPGDSYIPRGMPAIKPRPPVERQAHGIERLDRHAGCDDVGRSCRPSLAGR